MVFKTIRANGHFVNFENWVTVLYFNLERSSGTVSQASNMKILFIVPAFIVTQTAFTCSKSTIETPEQCVKSV